jgi:hypothetical protein
MAGHVCFLFYGIRNILRMVKVAKSMLAIPFEVKNAALILLRLLGFTIRCWYSRRKRNIAAPIVYSHPNCP